MKISGEAIKEAREARRMTQQELADAVGVSLRTVGSWERGESIPRNRLGAVREALDISSPEDDNRAMLARLLREQLSVFGVGTETFAKRHLPERSLRPFYSWVAGAAAPQLKNRAELEDALGWERGSITKILDAPITETISLAEVRDWAAAGIAAPAVARAAELSSDELVAELGRRLLVAEAKLSVYEGHEPAEPAEDPLPPVRNLFGLAAHNADHPGRMSEHLEEDD